MIELDIDYERFEKLDDLKEYLVNFGYEDTIILENPDYVEAVIGITDDGRLVYDYDLMTECLVQHDKMSPEEAMEFIDYNTIRALPYMGSMAPIVMHHFLY